MRLHHLPPPAPVPSDEQNQKVEAAMRETFRAAFGYDLGNAAAELSAETALAAANAAALAEGEGSAANLELQSTGPTARYLDELSPPSSEPDEQDVLRKGAEAAASAAGAAVGAAAGAAAGVAAEMAAAATSASYKVGSPFGWQEDGQIGWQEGGGWRKNKKKGEESFGEGSLGLRPRKIDPQKASEMVMDSVWSGNLKVGVGGDGQVGGSVGSGGGVGGVCGVVYKVI